MHFDARFGAEVVRTPWMRAWAARFSARASRSGDSRLVYRAAV